MFIEKGRFMRKAINLIRTFALLVVSAVLIAGTASVALSQSKDAKKLASATKEAQKAADVFTEIMNVPDQAIPQKLLDKAEAVAVFPGVIKAGFICGGRAGGGVISRRVKGGWWWPGVFNFVVGGC